MRRFLTLSNVFVYVCLCLSASAYLRHVHTGSTMYMLETSLMSSGRSMSSLDYCSISSAPREEFLNIQLKMYKKMTFKSL